MRASSTLLVAGMLTGATVMAQPAKSSVTLYGIADMGVFHVSNFSGKSVTRTVSGGLQGSRIGFRGSEDLGNGLRAIFTLENGFNVDTGSLVSASTLFNRQSFVGLSSNRWGTVTLGHQYTPSYDALVFTGFAPAFGGVAAAHHGVPGSTPGTAPVAAPTRFNNGLAGTRISRSVKYTSPTYSGFRVGLMYGFGEEQSGALGRTKSAALSYKSKEITAGLSYTETTGRVTKDPKNKIWAIGGIYDFGSFRLSGVYTRQLNSNNVRGLNADVFSTYLAVPYKSWEFKVGYSYQNDRSPDNWDGHQYAANAIYWLSKRTSVYATVAHQRVKNGGLAGQNFAPSGNGNQTQFGVGLRHVF